MRVHHLNCATMCPHGGRLVSGEGGLLSRSTMICHCLLAESESGLVLVDTGLGMEDVREPRRRLGGSFVFGMRPRCDPEETALRQVERLGFKAEDVRHIVVTHLDLDHAGGLSDFPKAKVHVYAVEHGAAMMPSTWQERIRYRAPQWAHGPDWARHELGGDRWMGFERVRDAEGLPPEVLLIPLVGHTRGHCGVAVKGEKTWLLHAGDAYFFRGEMSAESRSCPEGLDVFQGLIAADDEARRANQGRLRALAHDRAGEVSVFCAHDPVELSRHRREAGEGAGA